MNDDITQEPLARAVLAKLARTRGPDDPLGSLARTVLSGDADLRTAASISWYGTALHASFEEAMARRDTMSPQERAEHDRQARLLRDAGDDLTVPDEDDTEDEERPEGGQQR
ncbi:hypothetical protein [Verrucosispora sp. WMMC514]|uniref:hypothetical protein n=1 Tax=Verrucosispora sp. WMMC514 TaxID=3015156 RepID=UPI00248ABF1D|nr:hypothetical protein [Verrucosispora sp. WMMC514]WBB91448.1 hypothetical protein O7597_31580 [Verrucosispora sp. WMMC514]WBB91479.1 hypothetical protein O7597_00035 [Verrucosispora sp. WMMC514]